LLHLVEEERIIFRLVFDVGSSRQSSMPTPAEHAFLEAFKLVWRQIPLSDREHLLALMHGQSGTGVPGTDTSMGDYQPLFKVVARGPGAGLRPGCGLVFPCSLLASAERLPERIAQNLAEVYRYSSQAHWESVLALIEQPMDSWEEGEGRDASEEAHAKKLNSLEKKFLRKHKAALAAILSRWGFPCS